MNTFVPIANLKTASRVALLKKAKFETLKAGARLHAEENHHWLIYATKGVVRILDRGGHSLRGTEEDNHLFAARAANVVVIDTETQIVRFDRRLYDELSKQESRNGVSLTEVEMDNVEGDIFQEILGEYQRDQIELPGMPEIAERVRHAVADANTSSRQLEAILAQDPALAAKLLHHANSAMFGANYPATTLHEAIGRLGLGKISYLVTAHAVLGMFRDAVPDIRRHLKQVYADGVERAKYCFVIAREMRFTDPDSALLAGLLNEIGILSLLNQLVPKQAERGDDFPIDTLIHKLHRIVGGMILSKWGFGGEFIQAVEESGDWQRVGEDKPDLCDIVLAARWCMKQKLAIEPSSQHSAMIPALRKLKMEYLDVAGIDAMLLKHKDELSVLEAMFS